MKDHGGFGAQSSEPARGRVGTEVSEVYRSESFWEVREGLVKHFTAYDHPSKRKGFDAKILRLKRRSPISPMKSRITATIWMTG